METNLFKIQSMIKIFCSTIITNTVGIKIVHPTLKIVQQLIYPQAII